MAINTQNKRRSVQAYLFGAMRPVPDAAITAPDRRTLGWTYAFDAPAPAGGTAPLYPDWASGTGTGRMMCRG